MGDSITVVGHIWPKLTRCPECEHRKWKRVGMSRSGGVQYRQCLKCGHIYKIMPCADHIDRGGDQTEVRLR